MTDKQSGSFRPQTISSSLALSNISRNRTSGVEPEKAKALAAMLMQLSSHYYRPDFSPAQAKSLIGDMVEDLAEYTIQDVEQAIRAYRQDASKGYYPRAAHLRDLIATRRRAQTHAATINARMVDGEVQPWGGACQCRRCREKTPSDGFYRATPAEYATAAKEKREMDDWMRKQMHGDTASRAKPSGESDEQ